MITRHLATYKGKEKQLTPKFMITMEKPDVVPSKRYSINETSALLGIARSTLMVWTKNGYIKCQYHKVGLRKFYTGIEILRCWNSIA